MKIIAQNLDAIIFDMDGTVVLSNHTWAAKLVKVLLKNGVTQEVLNTIMAELERHTTGLDAKTCAQYFKEKFALHASIEELRQDLLLPFDDQEITPFAYVPGVVTFFQELKSHNIPISMATNSHRLYFTKVQSLMGLADYFGKHLYCIEDLASYKGKPHPDLFLFAANQLGVRPERCLVFEDSQHGFLAAKAAGMKCIAIKNDINGVHRDLVNGAIDSYDQAEAIIKQVLGLDK